MSEHKEPIPSMIYNASVGGHVTNSQQIIDENENKEQSQINAEVKQNLGQGGSVDSRIAAAVNTETTRAEGVEATLDGRIDTLEDAVGTGGSVDSRIAAAVNTETTRAQTAEADRYTKSETYTKEEVHNLITTPNQEYVSVTATSQTTAVTDVLPATGAADTTYRVGNWDGTQYNDSVFSEYAWNGNAYIKLSTKSQIGEVYDISANHADTKYADLATALGTNGANIPQTLRKGGMSVKFVQSSDNKYVQYRLMADTFNTTPTNWQGVDDEPTAGSDNLVKSGGVRLQELNKEFALGNVIKEFPYVGYIGNDGNIITNNLDYRYSDKIKIKSNDTLKVCSDASGGAAVIAFYTSNDGFISSVPGVGYLNIYTVEVPNNAAYARFTTTVNGKDDSYYLSVYKNSKYEQMEELYEEANSIALNIDKIDEFPYLGYLGTDGKLRDNSSYCTSSFIAVMGGKRLFAKLYGTGAIGVVSFYNSNKTFISSISGTGTFDSYEADVPVNAAFIRVTTSVANKDNSYVSYFIEGGIKNNIYRITSAIQGMPTASYELASLAPNVGINIHHFPQGLKKGHVLTFHAEFADGGFGDGFRIGFGYGGPGTSFIEVTPTQIRVWRNNYDYVETIEHNIPSFEKFIMCSVQDLTDGLLNKAGFRITTLNYGWGGQLVNWDWEHYGIAHAIPLDNTAFVNCKFSVGNTDLRKPIWCFGDSYWNMYAGGITYFFAQWGYTKGICINAIGGMNSAEAFNDLQRALSFGKPKYIVWSLGMNDSYSDWLSYFERVRQICKDNDITLIGVTIPAGKNTNIAEKQQITNYVRSCGLRYIDVYKALGCNSNGEWYNNGTDKDYQQSDGVHMSPYGGSRAAEQYLIDFPEIMQYYQ